MYTAVYTARVPVYTAVFTDTVVYTGREHGTHYPDTTFVNGRAYDRVHGP